MNTEKKQSILIAIVVTTLSIITGIATISCDGTMPTAYEQDDIVVQAYLYAGRPVDDIRLWRLGKVMKDTVVRIMKFNENDSMGFRLDSTDTIIQIYSTRTIDNAQVTISDNGVSHSLVLNDSNSYEDPSGALVITPGTTYRIDVTVDDRHAWAKTTVPRKIDNLRLSRDTLTKDTSGEGSMMDRWKDGPYVQPEMVAPDSLSILTIKWNNPTSANYMFRILYYGDYRMFKDPETDRNQSANQDSMGEAIPFDTIPIEPQWETRLTLSTQKDSMRIIAGEEFMFYGFYDWNPDSLGYVISEPGRYKIIICSTTPDFQTMEYAAADSMNHDRWPRSPTNINNGVGYFSSFNFDTAYFDIVLP